MCEMIENILCSLIRSKKYKIHKWTNCKSTNKTLVVGSSLLKDIQNEYYDCVSISRARVETITDYVDSMGEDIENYVKVCLLLGGNNLRDWKKELGESPMTVSDLKFDNG